MFTSLGNNFFYYRIYLLRFEINLFTIERVRFTLISKKTPLSKHSFRFDTVATTGHYSIVREGFAAPELNAIRQCSYVVGWIRVIDGIC
jgi:hypothetical protein